MPTRVARLSVIKTTELGPLAIIMKKKAFCIMRELQLDLSNYRPTTGIGNHVGDYAMWIVVANLTNRRLIFKENKVKLGKYFTYADGSSWSINDLHHATIINSDKNIKCDVITNTLKSEKDKVRFEIKAPKSFQFMVYCMSDGRKIFWNYSSITMNMHWKQILRYKHFKPLYQSFFTPSAVILREIPSTSYDIVHIRTGFTEDLGNNSITVNHKPDATVWANLNAGCPSNYINNVIKQAKNARRLLIISDAPSLCINAQIYHHTVQCPYQHIPRHSIYANESDIFYVARDLTLILHATVVSTTSFSTFALYSLMGNGKLIHRNRFKKIIPICHDCADVQRLSNNAYGWCHHYRMLTFSGYPYKNKSVVMQS